MIVDPDGKLLGKLGGKVPSEKFVGFLNAALEKYKGTAKVAQAAPGG